MSGSDNVKYRYGVWGSENEDDSSNFKEFNNLVETLELMKDDEDGLNGVEMFMFTDNSVTEGAVYTGSSTSMKLFDLVLRLKLPELGYGMRVNFIHVTETRMIVQGTDTLSRGNMLEGVMVCQSRLSYIPLHKGALVTQGDGLLSWIKSWWTGYSIEVLGTCDWFERGHDIDGYKKNVDQVDVPVIRSETFLWAPQAAAENVAIEELIRDRLQLIYVYVLSR